jgi:cysteine synthase
MRRLGLEREIVDPQVYAHAVERFRQARILLPTFSQLADPARIPAEVRAALGDVDPDAPHPLNLFRVHWYNGAERREPVPLPDHIVLPKALTGVEARIVIALGDRFPMIRAHKVLAAYGCLAPRIITGQFDPTAHRAVWPSTGNYARGGVAISRIMGCRGIAVLPEGMSRERFAWLERWVADPADIIRTPGTESNVKEIYDKCKELSRDPQNIIFNQFSEFGNHLIHYLVTGRALGHLFESLQRRSPALRLHAFVAASGSAGTLGAGDYLKERHGARIVAAEALECPTMLYNGFGEHNIQGIGDKHIPLIHNVLNTDVVLAVSDRSTDRLDVLFNTPVGREYLATRGVPPEVVAHLPALGLSSICNVVAAIKTAKYFRLGPDDVILTVATDGAAMYGSEREKALRRYFPRGFDALAAGETFAECLLGAGVDHLRECDQTERNRIFNLGYFTWVEQQGVSLEEFEARREQRFWQQMRQILPVWDAMIEEFNGRTRAGEAL